MALKTDYKDDVFSGDRKYQKKDNSDGTISLVDKTAYSQKGDVFSAADINATNKAVNGLSAVATTSANGLMSAEDKSKLDGIASGATKNVSTVKSFTLSASSWKNYEGDHWYYEIFDSLITATSNQEIIPATTITVDQLKAFQRANMLCDTQIAGQFNLRVFGTKPTIDIPITVIFRGTI